MVSIRKKTCARGTVEGHKLSSASAFLHAFSMGCRWTTLPRDKSLGFESYLPLGEGETM